MNVLGIIPARGGSKGVPGKNIKELGGKPLINYTIEVAKQSLLSRVIVSTDDELIMAVARTAGAEIPFVRPAELASDTSRSIDVALHALMEMELITGLHYDAIMLLQPTAPFKIVQDIDRAIELLVENPDADSVISVTDVKAHHPARMKYLENGLLIDPPFCESFENQNRQELLPMYIRNGAIYLSRRSTILSNSYKGKKSLAHVMPEIRSVNIDTLDDFEMAEWLFLKHIK
jgi:CMP-N,N'-diacetyllegionaminic acid synthase